MTNEKLHLNSTLHVAVRQITALVLAIAVTAFLSACAGDAATGEGDAYGGSVLMVQKSSYCDQWRPSPWGWQVVRERC